MSTGSKTSTDGNNTTTQEFNCVYNMEDILNFDSLPSFLTTSNRGEGESGSRFYQFFNQQSLSLQQQQNSQYSSAHDELFNSMVNDNNRNSIPPDRDTYFAPISPAAVTPEKSSSLLEMLQQERQDQMIMKEPSLPDLEVFGKIHWVEELESRLRQGHRPTNNQAVTKEEEIAAFKKLMMNKQNQTFSDQKLSSHLGVDSPNGEERFSSEQQQMQIPHEVIVNQSYHPGMIANFKYQELQRSHSPNMTMIKHTTSPQLEAGRHSSSQLARWFSPELLDMAQAGNLPTIPPTTPTLNVEDLERFQLSEAIYKRH